MAISHIAPMTEDMLQEVVAKARAAGADAAEAVFAERRSLSSKRSRSGNGPCASRSAPASPA